MDQKSHFRRPLHFFRIFFRLGRYIKLSNGTLATTTREQFTQARDLNHKYNET